jgi:hypothetical protein
MTSELMKDLLQVIWNRRAGVLLRKSGMIVLIASKGHLTQDIRSVMMQRTLALWLEE